MENDFGPKQSKRVYPETDNQTRLNRISHGLGEARAVFKDTHAKSKTLRSGSGDAAYEKYCLDQLYRKARKLNVPERSRLDRNALIEAIRKAEQG
ncbi:MAG: hypothetical protein AAGG56_06485 [Pseudomonadota bacterium]